MDKNIATEESIVNLREFIKSNPGVHKFIKYFHNDRHKPLPFLILTYHYSEPNKQLVRTIYGLFVFHLKNIKQNRKPQIKQDFLVNEGGAWIYYSGGGKDRQGSHQLIKNFCEKYGKDTKGRWGAYGCKPDLNSTNHWYKDENDSNLPGTWDQINIRGLINKEIEILRQVL